MYSNLLYYKTLFYKTFKKKVELLSPSPACRLLVYLENEVYIIDLLEQTFCFFANFTVAVVVLKLTSL